MSNRDASSSEDSLNTADMPVLKVRGSSGAGEFDQEFHSLEQSVQRLKQAISHRLGDEKSELLALRRELKDSATLVATQKRQLESEKRINEELTRSLKKERTLSASLRSEHAEGMAQLTAELSAAKLILGDALGAPEPPRNSLIVKKPDPGQDQGQRSADTAKPKALVKR